MSTLILKAPGALSAPLAGTPMFPDLSRGILMDFNAETLALADAASVLPWKNSGGSWGASADLLYTVNNPPKFAIAGVSPGHASVRFSLASTTMLKTLSSTPIVPRADTPITVIALLKFSNAADGATYQNVFSGRTGDAGGYIYARRGPTGRMSMGGGAVEQLVPDIVPPVGTWFVLTCVFDGVNSKMFIDKVKTTGTTSAAYWDGLSLGANAVGTNNLNGDIAAIKAYSRALSDSEVLLQREAWLTARGLAA